MANKKAAKPDQPVTPTKKIDLDAGAVTNKKAPKEFSDMVVKEIMFQKGMTFDEAKDYLNKNHK